MIDMQEKFTEQFEQFSQYRKDAVASLQARGAAGVDSYEKFARLNLAVLGDVVDFTVGQARLVTTAADPAEHRPIVPAGQASPTLRSFHLSSGFALGSAVHALKSQTVRRQKHGGSVT